MIYSGKRPSHEKKITLPIQFLEIDKMARREKLEKKRLFERPLFWLITFFAVVFALGYFSGQLQRANDKINKLNCELGLLPDSGYDCSGTSSPAYVNSDVLKGHWECQYQNVTKEVITDVCAENYTLKIVGMSPNLPTSTLNPYNMVVINFQAPSDVSITEDDFERLNVLPHPLFTIHSVELDERYYYGDVCSKIFEKHYNRSWVGIASRFTETSLSCEGDFLVDFPPYRISFTIDFPNWKSFIAEPIPPEFKGLEITCFERRCTLLNNNRFWDVMFSASANIELANDCPRWNVKNVTAEECVKKIWVSN